MIPYIRYNRDGGFEIYEGPLQIEQLSPSDFINAINQRLKNIPNRNTTLAYHQYAEETCFLVKLVYDFDQLEQYFEKSNDDLILNFCNKEFVSIYSIRFSSKERLVKESILDKNWSVKFTDRIKAPLITLEDIRANKLLIYFFHLQLGREIYRDNLYYKNNEVAFCLPVSLLIEEMIKNGEIENYIQNINITINYDLQRVNIQVISLKHAYGKRHLENNYYGYLDLSKFTFIIEKHEDELLKS